MIWTCKFTSLCFTTGNRLLVASFQRERNLLSQSSDISSRTEMSISRKHGRLILFCQKLLHQSHI